MTPENLYDDLKVMTTKRDLLAKALKPFSFCDADSAPPGITIMDWRAAVHEARRTLEECR